MRVPYRALVLSILFLDRLPELGRLGKVLRVSFWSEQLSFSRPISIFLMVIFLGNAGAEEVAIDIEEVVVSASSSIHKRLGQAGSASIISREEILQIGATHISETLARVPGVWVSRGSGQEHLAAIRSPIYTGSGACGEFSYMEDGIPIRPAGFCNINNLFELNTEQAKAIEIWRGPASAVLGGNALHGAINVISPTPSGLSISAEGGAYDYYRTHVKAGKTVSNQDLGFSFVGSESGGYREDTGYGQQKLYLSHATEINEWSVQNHVTLTNLNQETGGYVKGDKSYEDGVLRKSNPNPEAYRDAWSFRANSEINKGRWTIKPYVRRSGMAFLQHFLPGQPLETNDQGSGGVLLDYSLESDTYSGHIGVQVEAMDGSLMEYQAGPTVSGSAFLVATRPPGMHYDYDVTSFMSALFYDLRFELNEHTRIIHSLRQEFLEYDYENNHLVGNTKDDGTACGFGGCLYSRPASRKDAFSNTGLRLGLERDLDSGMFYGSLSTGFRPPQVTELYRLRGGQTIADLDSERLESFELGFKSNFVNAAAFIEKTENFMLRDSEAFNVSDGKTKSRGLELEGFKSVGKHTWSASLSYAIHEYDFDRAATGRETIKAGNNIDTAPKWLGSMRWRTEFSEALAQELELVFVGKHYVNAANTAEYSGHEVLNWRGHWQLNEQTRLFARIINILDEDYADRADYAFGDYRYFPAMPRQLYVGVNLAVD